MPDTLEVFIDFVCPYCFLAEGALLELQKQRDVQIDIRPFELRPEPIPTLKPENDYLPRVWQQSVYPLAQRLGVDIVLPTVSPQPRTTKAFIGLQLAKEADVAQAYTLAMYQAFFQQDRNIGDEAVILDVAKSVGLDTKAVRAALASDERRQLQHQAVQFAQNVGVTAVPAVRSHGRLFSGLMTVDDLLRIVDTGSRLGT